VLRGAADPAVRGLLRGAAGATARGSPRGALRTWARASPRFAERFSGVIASITAESSAGSGALT
jgi:hypothetical protein